jgi:hypothetical protein
MVQSVIRSTTDVDPAHHIRMPGYKRVDRPLRRHAIPRRIRRRSRTGPDNWGAADLGNCYRILIARPYFESKQITSVVGVAIAIY